MHARLLKSPSDISGIPLLTTTVTINILWLPLNFLFNLFAKHQKKKDENYG